MVRSFAIVLFLMSCLTSSAADVQVDFSNIVGKVNPRLHSSGWAPRTCPRTMGEDDADIAAMNLYACRTHDWALVNAGQRTVDTQYIFPLMHLDAKDPKNYFFTATDESLKLAHGVGLKVLYRLGTSIEHTKEYHCNALAPSNAEKYAEVLAGIMRHYLRGWANGYEWADRFDGWEIWNEPDNVPKCWVLPDCTEQDAVKRAAQHQTAFCKFFAIVLKRLKSEFPDQRIGGPGLSWADTKYFTELLDACKAQGVTPDFVSWHDYTCAPRGALGGCARMRKLLDSRGLQDVRTMITEWHYLVSWEHTCGFGSATPASMHQAYEGPSGHLNIDSAALNLALLCEFQRCGLDEAYYYGLGLRTWGYKNAYNEFNKTWYSMKMFGDFTRACGDRVSTSVATNRPTVYACAGLGKDGKTASLLVVDYRGQSPKLTVGIRGLSDVASVAAVCLDHARDLVPVPVRLQDGVLTLPRADANSAAFLVTFRRSGAK